MLLGLLPKIIPAGMEVHYLIFRGKQDLEKNLATKQNSLNIAQMAVTKVKEDQKSEHLLIKKVRALDLFLSEKQSAVKTAAQDCRKMVTQVSEKKELRKKLKLNLAVAGTSLSRVETYLSEHARDGELVTHLTGITEQIRTLQTAMRKMEAASHGISDFEKQLEAQTRLEKQQSAACHTLKEHHAAVTQGVAETNQKISALLGDRMLREYRAEHESLLREMAYLRKIESLEDQRTTLADGSPCPLCGSLHHPYARGNVPKMDETENAIKKLSHLIHKAEQLEKALKDQESREKKAASALADAEKQRVQVLHKKEDAKAWVIRSKNEQESLFDHCTRLKQTLVLSLEPFDIQRIPDSDPDDLLKSLTTRQKNWQDHQKQKIEIEKTQAELFATLSSLDEILQTLDASGKEKQTVLSVLQKELETLDHDRNTLYGRKHPDIEEARLENMMTQTEDLAKTARQVRDEIKQRLNDVTTRISALKESTAARQPELSALEVSFIANCQASGFEDEPALLASRLSWDERNMLIQSAAALDEKQAEIVTQKKDREARLSREAAKMMTPIPLDPLKQEQAQTRETLKILGEQIGAIKQRLTDNTTAKARLQEKLWVMDRQRAECGRWDALHALIGSADGKKYRNFAQGLTFEVMVSHANQQLEKMTDRYLLIRDEKHPLELNIVDNYQAGEIRSTKNLSGGESFIVSLSLALGLSHMASRNVRVDSLFLDEGFGTLDEDALETSLEALSGLQQAGKLIGIISHVPALKERISTQIIVQPVSGGKSTVSGPGCEAIN